MRKRINKYQLVIIPTFGFTRGYDGYYISFSFLCFQIAFRIKEKKGGAE